MDIRAAVCTAALAVVLPAMAGCWNSPSNTEVYCGDPSVGQQLLELQSALERGAISAEEHAVLKEAVVARALAASGGGDE